MKVMRATELWQQTGAFYVRIQAMGRKYHIPLHNEFDVHDTPVTKYIVILDDDFPVATCRFFPVAQDIMEIGRVVVLEEYRERGLGQLLITEAERWIKELGCRRIFLESRDEAVGFYKKLGYKETEQKSQCADIFICIHMEKEL